MESPFLLLAPKIYVINLARRADRRRRLEARFSAAHTPFPVEFVAAVDEKELSTQVLEAQGIRPFIGWRSPSLFNPWYARDLKMGEIACTLSHRRVWELAVRQRTKTAIIFEDDAEFEPSLWQSLGPAANALSRLDWDLFYLGRAPRAPDVALVDEAPLIRPGFSYCCHAYALSASGLNKVLELPLTKQVVPVDEFLPALYAGHPRRELHDLYPAGTLRAFALQNSLVSQEEGFSDIESSPQLSADVSPQSPP